MPRSHTGEDTVTTLENAWGSGGIYKSPKMKECHKRWSMIIYPTGEELARN